MSVNRPIAMANEPLQVDAHTYRPAQVLRNTELTRHVRRLTVGGSAVRAMLSNPITSEPAAWLKVKPGKRAGRAYTIAAFDAKSGTMDIDFVLHGCAGSSDTVAAWADMARVGDALEIAGPRAGGFKLLPDSRWICLGCDEAGLPAVRSILTGLPAQICVSVVVEALETAESEALGSAPGAVIAVVDGNEGPGAWELTVARIARATEGPGQVWVAGEAGMTKRWRNFWLLGASLTRDHLVAKGYWKVGAVDHRD